MLTLIIAIYTDVQAIFWTSSVRLYLRERGLYLGLAFHSFGEIKKGVNY